MLEIASRKLPYPRSTQKFDKWSKEPRPYTQEEETDEFVQNSPALPAAVIWRPKRGFTSKQSELPSGEPKPGDSPPGGSQTIPSERDPGLGRVPGTIRL